jgi:hypothetical protein
MPSSNKVELDRVFSPGSTKDVFTELHHPVSAASEGHQVKISLYGQSAAGKRTTMFNGTKLWQEQRFYYIMEMVLQSGCHAKARCVKDTKRTTTLHLNIILRTRIKKKEPRALFFDGKEGFFRRGVPKPAYETFPLRLLDAVQVLRKRVEQ